MPKIFCVGLAVMLFSYTELQVMAKNPSEIEKLQKEGVEYFRKFKTAEEFIAALNADDEMKEVMRVAYWLSLHQEPTI